MQAPEFAHLRLRTEYSIKEGIARLQGDRSVVRQAAQAGVPALGLADADNMFGAVKFYAECRKCGVKPVVGCDIRVPAPASPEARMLMLCASNDGFVNLSRLLSRAYAENGGKIKSDWLTPDSAADIIALSGARNGAVGLALQRRQADNARRLADQYARQFPGRFHMEISRAFDGDREISLASAQLAQALGLPLVATHPVLFADDADFETVEIRACIANGWQLNDPDRPRPFSKKQKLLAPKEMAEKFSDLPGALQNAAEVAKRCNFQFQLDKTLLPQLKLAEGETPADSLRRESESGLKRIFARDPQAAARRAEYEKRLAHEISVIVQMGFADYFLIVAEFVNWAKKEEIPVGPGRGSGAGSLAAYALEITALDPVRHGLIFERFLNPERVSLPDFDIDFCMDGRDRVIEHVRIAHGRENVSQIVTFGAIGARGAVRDVGRALGMPYGQCDRLARMIPHELDMTLEKAQKESPDFAREIEENDSIRRLYDLALKVEGLPRNIGTHAGGVLIAPAPIAEFCPLYAAPDSSGLVSQLDMDDVARVGLVKFDFLGLRTLTMLAHAENSLRESGEVPPDFSLEKIPTDDAPTYRLYAEAETAGVFQCESGGMRELMRQMKPDRFEDIVALVALFRPGPLNSGMVDQFIRRKRGTESAEYPHESLRPALEETFGVCVYQEQVMQIARTVAGYSPGQADILRRAMGKKKPEEMAAERERFVSGAKGKLSPRAAEELFNTVEKFAGYGFNKSHAAAYALLSYRSAYLKANHPAAFYAAAMSANRTDTKHLAELARDARKRGAVILPPDINRGGADFKPVGGGRVRFGLSAARGVGAGAVADIIRARGDKPFADLFDFCRRVAAARQPSAAAVESLIRAGAFDSLHPNRASALETLPMAMAGAGAGEGRSLFGGALPKSSLVDVTPWSAHEKLKEERRVLNFCLSGSMFDLYSEFLRGIRLNPPNLGRAREGMQNALVAGVLSRDETTRGMRGAGMRMLVLEDSESELEVKVNRDLTDGMRLQAGEQLLLAEGRIDKSRGANGGLAMSARALYDLDDWLGRRLRRLTLHCRAGADAAGVLRHLEVARLNGKGPAGASGSGSGGGGLGGSGGGGAGGGGGGGGNGGELCEVAIDYDNGLARCRIGLGGGWRMSANIIRALRENPDVTDCKLEYS